MKTKPLDANTSSTHANTSSVHERGSRPPAHQGSVENTNDASPSSSDNTNKAAVPSDLDNSTPKDACQVTQALTRNHKKVIQVNLHVSYSTCISIQILPYCPYLQLRQKNIQLLLMTMKLRMKMEKLKGLLSVSHTIHQHLGDN